MRVGNHLQPKLWSKMSKESSEDSGGTSGPPSKTSLVLKSVFISVFFPITLPFLIYGAVQSFRKKFGLKGRPLEGKVVLITGASSGIGEALAQKLYLSGCKLILASRRVKELERVKAGLVRIQTYGTVYIPAVVGLDLEHLASIGEKSAELLAIYGHIDILINNAGKSYRGNVLKTDIELDQRMMLVNYFGPLALTKYIGRSMVKRRSGQIAFISSVQGKIAIPHRSAYAASKHAVQALADCLRAELSSKGVSVTVISPSYVKTELSLHALTETGTAHGRMDPTTAAGYPPSYVADRVVEALMKDEKDVIIANLVPKAVIFIRNILPSVFFNLMSSRADS